MQPLAHSARAKRGIPPQPYCDHVTKVEGMARGAAEAASRRWSGRADLFRNAVIQAARMHDIGKLHPQNQRILASSETKPLDTPHELAGILHLLDRKQGEAAALVFSHHLGLPALMAHLPSREPFRTVRRDVDIDELVARVQTCLESNINLHEQCGAPPSLERDPRFPAWRKCSQWSGLTWRIALSCLVDADHSDTASHYSASQRAQPLGPRWQDRLISLDQYVAGLALDAGPSARTELRQRVYRQCRDLSPSASIYECDSGVGTGKTTAVMAHLLRVAQERDLRHIFVVLPFTNIIDQSVEVYRKALSLPGEAPEGVVAAHHHEADFSSPDARDLATLWDCPVIVTTAVQFFETLAASSTARLRKLHQLPGSAIFIDEAHAALPAPLWPQTWEWLNELTSEWGCHAVLASGSLVRIWQEPDVVKTPAAVPNLLSDRLQNEARQAETVRVSFPRKQDRMRALELVEFIRHLKGPRLVVVNTVLSAAAIARACGNPNIGTYHMSTALAPRDRERMLARVRERLKSAKDTDWALIATSCVESGLDFSFCNAVRQRASAASLIQVGGRVNRSAAFEAGAGRAEVWTVEFDDPLLTNNSALRTSAQVLDSLANDMDRMSASELCTEALRRELADRGVVEAIAQFEQKLEFPEVSKRYQVIGDDTVTAVVDKGVAEALTRGERIGWREVLDASVRVRRARANSLHLPPLRGDEDLRRWTLDYDSEFLGYAAALLDVAAATAGEFLEV